MPVCLSVSGDAVVPMHLPAYPICADLSALELCALDVAGCPCKRFGFGFNLNSHEQLSGGL